jgi:hypothetical protein
MTKDLPTRYLASPPPDVEPHDDHDAEIPTEVIVRAIAWGAILGLAFAALLGRVVYVLVTGG